VVVQPDGRIVIAGSTQVAGVGQFLVARFLPDDQRRNHPLPRRRPAAGRVDQRPAGVALALVAAEPIAPRADRQTGEEDRGGQTEGLLRHRRRPGWRCGEQGADRAEAEGPAPAKGPPVDAQGLAESTFSGTAGNRVAFQVTGSA
jgi:hypothetical protein